MYLDKHLYYYVYAIQTMIMLVPILYYGYRYRLFEKWSWTVLFQTINKALIPHILIGMGLAIGAKIIDIYVYSDNLVSSNIFTDIFMGLTYCYLVIGLFFYLPSLVLLNLISFLTRKIVIKS